MNDETRAALYVRVSTADQDTDAQESELRRYAEHHGWSVYKVYRDRGQSGAKNSRSALDELMSDCRRRRVDAVLVWKFDRFARSLKHLITALEEFKERGVDFVSCTEQIDTSTSSGKCFFQIVGAIAEFERDLVSERVKAGLAYARKRGKRLGRPPVRQLSSEQQAQLRSERARRKVSLRVLARKYGVTLWTAHSLCRARG